MSQLDWAQEVEQNQNWDNYQDTTTEMSSLDIGGSGMQDFFE